MDEETRNYRFDLLRFAKELLWEDFANRRQKSDVEFDIRRYAYENNKLKDMPAYTPPNLPTADDIIKIAETFNKYVTKTK